MTNKHNYAAGRKVNLQYISSLAFSDVTCFFIIENRQMWITGIL